MYSGELQAMMEFDDRHWWYRGRRRIVRAQLDRLRLPEYAVILDAGCGSGRTLDELRDYGTVAGIDVSQDAVTASRLRGHKDVREGRLEALPWPDEWFDLVTCLDVIEHTPDDRVTLREVWRVTKPGGHAVVSVPAYQMLWSQHDVANQHYRRYGRRTFRAAAQEAGWTVRDVTSFNTVLFAPAAVVRIAQRWTCRHDTGENRSSDLVMGPDWLNTPFEALMRAEAAIVRAGGRLPFGLSLLAVLSRP